MVFSWALANGEGQEKASEKAERFLTMIPEPTKRIFFAEKFQNFDVAMDVSGGFQGYKFVLVYVILVHC